MTASVTHKFVEFIPDKLQPNCVYISKKFGCAIHSCLCGCGLKTVLILRDDWWTLTEHIDGTISFNPSILNSAKKGFCGAHYVIDRSSANVVIEK